MAYLSIVTDTTGQVGVYPRRVKIVTESGLSTVSAAGFLNASNLEGQVIYPTDVFDIIYSFNQSTKTGTYGKFLPTVTAGVITLTIVPQSVQLPVVAGDLAYFYDTSGIIADTSISYLRVQQSLFDSPSPTADLVPFDIAPGFGTLASAGKVNLIVSSGSRQYRIRTLYMGLGSNFSGGGGDRLARITDGTTVYSVIPAANLQTLANSAWGSTAIPLPASVTLNTITAAGANLYVEYQGGTTDYTAGLMSINGLLERVA